MYKPNPYRPGAGLMPIYLAGRDEDIDKVEQIFEALQMKIPVQSLIFSGLRGVGKTVLINHLQKIAEDKEIFCRHIEIEEKSDFIAQIATSAQIFLQTVSTKEKLKNLVQKGLDAIKTLVVSFSPEDNTFSISVQEKDLYRSSSLTQSLTELFVTIGDAADKANTPICFFIDEIQYMKTSELNSLIAALHRSNQLGFPIMVIGAGLPRIYKMLSDAKSYVERLFEFTEIGSLTEEQSKKAIIEPAKKFGVSYSDEAVAYITKVSKGYPFFIQQLCKIVYQENSAETIEAEVVERVLPKYYEALDNGFFKVRYERCSDSEKKFAFAMVACEVLPCTISNVAAQLHKTTQAISPTRGQLINKGIIYSVRYSELDFTVPDFDGYIQRRGDYQEWKEKKDEKKTKSQTKKLTNK